MKKTIILFISLISITNLFAQRSQTEKIADIKTWYKELTSNINSYEKLTVDYPYEIIEGGGKITYYKKDGMIDLFEVAYYYGEIGKEKFSFYFRNNKLFFVFQVTENYGPPGCVVDDRKIIKDENRYYFYCNKMIKWLDGDKKEVSVKSLSFKSKEEELLKDVDELL